jgi:2-phospho-L-lactate guanylyltransferase
MARDTLESVCRALPPADVVTVTSDPDLAGVAAGLGAMVEPDPGAGLNAAIRAGLDRAAPPDDGTGRPQAALPLHLAVLLGDLPALRPEDLAEALELCAMHPVAVVPDQDGTGTVLLTMVPGHRVEPRFGGGSAARHAAAPGAVLLPLDLPHLRRDVDDVGSLAEAAHLGVGRHTSAVLATACLPAFAD